MASKDEHSNEDNCFGANTVEAENEYIVKEASSRKGKGPCEVKFQNKLLRLIGEIDLESRREIQNTCDRLDSCLESAIDVMSSLSDLLSNTKKLTKAER